MSETGLEAFQQKILYTFQNQQVLEEALRHSSFVNEQNHADMRANLVNESQLASIARNLNLGAYLQLGKGEIQTHGQEKNSILAGALEAVIAAVYLDGGFASAYQLIESHFAALPDRLTTPLVKLDYKSRLQELAQISFAEIPVYTIIEESGPDHDKTFKVRLTLSKLQAEGVGKSKKAAEQDAARNGLEMLKTWI